VEQEYNAIDWTLCLQKVAGNEALAKEFLELFVEELSLNKTQFWDLFKAKDTQGLAFLAHKLHGAACFCGVPTFLATVIDFENILQEQRNTEVLESPFLALLQSMEEVIAHAKQLL
jgi:two-component system sensor histidine kinase BarA